MLSRELEEPANAVRGGGEEEARVRVAVEVREERRVEREVAAAGPLAEQEAVLREVLVERANERYGKPLEISAP